MFNINYKIKTYEEQFSAGPYSFEEALYQKTDIAGFEGVYDVEIVPVKEETNEY